MPHAKSLTKRIKVQRTPLILERDHPNSKLAVDDPNYEEPVCCYCEQRFLENDSLWKKTWEHLDDNAENEEAWNLSWAHWKCNQDKKFNYDFQIIAIEIIKRNQEWYESNDFESARERKIKSPTEEQTEIDLNVAHMQVTREFLAEKLPHYESKYVLKDTIFCIVARCRKLTGHGSPQSVRNYIDELSCSEQPYKIEKQNGKNYIFRRIGQ